MHLYTQGYTDADLINFELILTSPSIIYEKQKVELLNEKLGLVANFKESGMFSERYIYENVFGMSQNEWTTEQDQVIEDLKQEFRKEQIKSEGNDPQKTNQSFGTPHDIAAMHMQGNLDIPGAQDEGADNPVAGPGRPKKYGSWNRANSDYGRDALGDKSIDNAFATDKSPLQHKYRGGSPLSTEALALASFLSKKTKSSSILHESLSTVQKDLDKGTILDESILIQDEKA